MKQQLIEAVISMLKREGYDIPNIEARMAIIFEPYTISRAETALTTRSILLNDDYFRRFLACKMVSGRTENTINLYGKNLRFIFGRINRIADEVTTDDIRVYIARRQLTDRVKPATVNSEIRTLKTFFSWMTDEGIIQKDITKRIEQVKMPKIKKDAFSDIDIERIRNACQDEREKAIVEVLISTGCRVSELTGIQKDDIDGERVLVHGKGQKDRYVYLNAKAVLAIENYLSGRKDDNPYLFPSSFGIYENKSMRKFKSSWWKHPECVSDKHADKSTIEATVRGIGKRAGVKNVHPHRFRRTCATNALKRGMGLIEVSRMLGHENVQTTQIYLDISDDVVESAHRKFVT